MNEVLTNFHFLRPEWFYALIPATVLYTLLKYRQSNNSNWEKTIDPTLLPYLLDSPEGEVSKSPMTLLFIAWLLATIALAGPVWEKTQQPVHEREDALVVLLDLTRSMYATDVKPNRLIRARRKLQDLLNQRTEGVTALVVFAGDAHVVSPLTDDTGTIAAMIPSLTPEIMPASGSQLAPALQRAIALFEDAGVTSGRILIVTDEIRDIAEAQSIARTHRFSYPVSVMSVGSSAGSPIPVNSADPNSGYMKDRAGNLVIAKVDRGALADFASVASGRFTPITLTDEDIDYLLAPDPMFTNPEYMALERDFDVWHEEGPWLLLLLLPLASLAFRRGWLWVLALVCIFPVEKTYAFDWADLWQTKDQQGIAAMQSGEHETAAGLFEDPGWRGSALYRGESYQDAASQFSHLNTSDGRYNLGNAFARQMRLEEAIEAYDEALALDPANEDAAFNKKLVEELQQQQQQQQQDQQDQQQEEGEDQEQQTGENDEEQQGEPEQQEGETEEGEEQEVAEQDSELDSEEEQALQQWLRRVPDDPGGLLRRKFEAQHDERLKQGQVSTIQGSGDW
jgi:Ca-activated chloride channel homolog